MEAASVEITRNLNVTPLNHLETSLRHLLSSAEYASYHESEPAHDEEVILELHLDGYHYVLIRTVAPESQVSLSPREREIVQLIAKGFPNKAIALVLNISPCTVATYLQRIFTKLGVNSRVEVVARLIQSGTLQNNSVPHRPSS